LIGIVGIRASGERRRPAVATVTATRALEHRT
jgi:hypothetical protein